MLQLLPMYVFTQSSHNIKSLVNPEEAFCNLDDSVFYLVRFLQFLYSKLLTKSLNNELISSNFFFL